MRKFVIIGFGVMFLLLMSAGIALAAPRVVVNGQELAFDVPPVIEQGRTLVPLRVIFEALGANVNWDDPTQTVTATKGGTEIKLIIGGLAYKNGQPIILDVPAKIINGRTLVPLRFVGEAMGSSVRWKDATQTVTIYYAHPDEATFRKYFLEINLGKLPAGGQLPFDLQQNVDVFARGEEVYVCGTILQEVRVSTAIYDMKTKKFVLPKQESPRPLPPGGFAGSDSGTRNLLPGEYEYRIYVGDALVAVIPFDITD